MMIAEIIVIYKRIEMPWVPWLVWNLLFIALVNPVLFYESIFHHTIVPAAPGLFPNLCHILIPMGFSWFSSFPKPVPLNTPFLKLPPLKHLLSYTLFWPWIIPMLVSYSYSNDFSVLFLFPPAPLSLNTPSPKTPPFLNTLFWPCIIPMLV